MGQRSFDELVDHDSERVDVRADVDPTDLTPCLLGAHVLERPDDLSCARAVLGFHRVLSERPSDAEIDQLNEKRQAFFKETEVLRNDINAKELELRAELAKKNPDSKVAASLQKELSELEARFDEKRINHRIEMKKINPDLDGSSMGYRMRRGGGYGSGYCWWN